MESAKVVTKQQGQALADEYGLPFFEVSAKRNINIHEVLTSFINELLHEIYHIFYLKKNIF